MTIRIYSSSELSIQDYHAARDYESSSDVKQILTHPAQYLFHKMSPSRDTQALQIGSAIHAAVLEPEAFNELYVVSEKVDRRTSKGKQAYHALVDAHPGKHILTVEDLEMFQRIRDKIMAKSDIHKLLYSKGVSESSIFWTDEETGVNCKIRPDRLVIPGNEMVIVSLKTTACAAAETFKWDIEKYRYHVSDAMYEEGIYQAYGKHPLTLTIVIEKDTWEICKYRLSERARTEGYEEFRRGLNLIKQCREQNSYPGYQEEGTTVEIDLPERAYRKSPLRLAA
jgi:exodeoxyribonuclease VIII